MWCIYEADVCIKIGIAIVQLCGDLDNTYQKFVEQFDNDVSCISQQFLFLAWNLQVRYWCFQKKSILALKSDTDATIFSKHFVLLFVALKDIVIIVFGEDILNWLFLNFSTIGFAV